MAISMKHVRSRRVQAADRRTWRGRLPLHLLLIALLFALPRPPCAHAGEKVVIVSGDYVPYTSSEKSGSGAAIDIVRKSLALVEIEVNFKFYPWKRCETHVKHGTAFAAVPYFKTKERHETFNFSNPIIRSFNRFFYRKAQFPNGFQWKTLKDFKGYRMGGILGYWYLPAFKRAGLDVVLVRDDVQNLTKLSKGRIDFTVIDEITGKLLIEKHLPKEADSIAVLEKPESFDTFHLLTSRSYPDSGKLQQAFNRGLKMLIKSGDYHRILKAYNFPAHFTVESPPPHRDGD
ncbi:MAG: substrate-binding periplasmic protein [Planctomycetota bacterium]|jgi:polar amino acid transport system substrate-binding protein